MPITVPEIQMLVLQITCFVWPTDLNLNTFNWQQYKTEKSSKRSWNEQRINWLLKNLFPVCKFKYSRKRCKAIIQILQIAEQREAQRLASSTGERTSPYLFISSALWPKYLAKRLLEKRAWRARPPCPKLILALLIKMRITCTKHSEGVGGADWEENPRLTFT